MDAPIDLQDFEQRAEQRLDPATFAFIAAGAGAEITRRRNSDAFRHWCLVPRALRDVSSVSTETQVLGQQISMPVLVAPMGLQRIAHPEGECAMAQGVKQAQTIMCISTVSTRSPAEIAVSGVDRWYQLYMFKDRGVTNDLLAQAKESGCQALIVTVDGTVIGRRPRALRAGFKFGSQITIPSCGRALGLPGGADPVALGDMLDRSATWQTLRKLAEDAGLPLVVKGVLSPADADLACKHGAAAIVVSNHGGRQLDGTPATLSVLPAIVQAVAGRAQVLIDGGIRSGTDVLIALALGAQAVMIGRPAYWGLAVNGAQGVTTVLELLRAEIEQALTLLGCASPGELSRHHLIKD